MKLRIPRQASNRTAAVALLLAAGATEMRCDHAFDKGDELGWFEHGSTIIVLAPRGLRWAAGISPGQRIRVGQALFEGARGDAGSAMPGPMSSP
jgi:phosphatidylserine decarboxylase